MRPIPITFILPDLGGGGAQKVMLAVAGGLDRQAFALSILVVGGSQAFASHVPAGVPIEIGNAQRLRDGLPWLVRRIRETQPAVCVSVMGYLNLMLLGARKFLPRDTRLVIREANTVAATIEALPRWVPARTLYRSLYKTADVIVSPTASIASEIAAMGQGAGDKVTVIPNPVDVAGLRTRSLPVKRKSGSGLRLVSAGRLTRQKGYDRLLDLVPHMPPDSHLTVLGEGEDRGDLEAKARTLGIVDRVSFPGFSLDVPAWIAGADVFLLPSRWEGLPNVVLESLAIGTPVLASDEAAVTDLARAATPSAVNIRPVDRRFAASLFDYTPRGASSAALRPSLLPAMYERTITIESWSKLLSRIVSNRALATDVPPHPVA